MQSRANHPDRPLVRALRSAPRLLPREPGCATDRQLRVAAAFMAVGTKSFQPHGPVGMKVVEDPVTCRESTRCRFAAARKPRTQARKGRRHAHQHRTVITTESCWHPRGNEAGQSVARFQGRAKDQARRHGRTHEGAAAGSKSKPQGQQHEPGDVVRLRDRALRRAEWRLRRPWLRAGRRLGRRRYRQRCGRAWPESRGQRDSQRVRELRGVKRIENRCPYSGPR